MSGPRYEVTACVLVHRRERWLLGVRASGVDHSPGSIGLIGGHLESASSERHALELTARREVAEEANLDLTGVALTYLESELFLTDACVPQVTVTFVAAAPDGVEPAVGTPEELAEVRWWTRAEVAADPRCPDWLPALLDRAALRR